MSPQVLFSSRSAFYVTDDKKGSVISVDTAVVEEQMTIPIKVFLVGMDERSTARMATIFKIIFKGRCEFAQGNDANLAIVDIDEEANIWEKFQRQHPELPAIVMSGSPADIEGAVYVAKPAKLDLLWDSIFSLVTGLPPVAEIASKTDSTVTPVPAKSVAEVKSEPEKSGISTAASAMDAQFKTTGTGSKVLQGKGVLEEAALYYDPGEYLLGHILSSIKDSAGQECAIHVKCWSDRQLILLPGKGLAYTNLTDSQLKSLGVATINEEFTIDINSVCGTGKGELPASEIDGLQSMSIDYLVWDLALRTARGRVPKGTDLSIPLYLRRWPNFPRLPRTPHGMRIASLWVESPRPLDDVAMNLGVERSDVYSFYSAAVAIGLAGPAKRQVDNLIAPNKIEKEEPSRRGLLASILRHITK